MRLIGVLLSPYVRRVAVSLALPAFLQAPVPAGAELGSLLSRPFVS